MCHHFGSLYEEDDTPTSDPELDFGACYSLPTYWIGQTLMHSWAGRVLLHDSLAQAVSWARDHNVSSPALQHLRVPISPSEFSAQDDSIAMALSTDLSGCIELLQQAQDLAGHMVLKCIRFTFAKEFGVINLAQASIAIYVVLQYFREDIWQRSYWSVQRLWQFLKREGWFWESFSRLIRSTGRAFLREIRYRSD
jgi:hypothetical protein